MKKVLLYVVVFVIVGIAAVVLWTRTPSQVPSTPTTAPITHRQPGPDLSKYQDVPKHLRTFPSGPNDVPLETPKGDDPRLPYHLSYPKLITGLLYLEKSSPELAVTPAQCKDLIPAFDALGTISREIFDTEKALLLSLTDKQRDYIIKNWKTLDEYPARDKANEYLEKKYNIPLTLDEFGAIALFCKKRAAEGVSGPAVKIPSKDEKSVELPPVPQAVLSTGLLTMDENPDLRISSAQAEKIGPMFETLSLSNENSNQHELTIKNTVTSEQIEGFAKKIEKDQTLGLSGYNRHSGGANNDPLYSSIIELCQSKISETGASEK